MTLVANPVLTCDADQAGIGHCPIVMHGHGGDSQRQVRDDAQRHGWARIKVKSRWLDLCPSCDGARRSPARPKPLVADTRPSPFTVRMAEMVQATGFSELALAHMAVGKLLAVELPTSLRVAPTLDAVAFLPRDRDRLIELRERLDYAEFAKKYPQRQSSVDRPQAFGMILRLLNR